MGKRFEVGKTYDDADGRFEPITIVKRTEKTLWFYPMFYSGKVLYRQKIHIDKDGNEFTYDSRLPRRYYTELYTSALFEVTA